MKRQSSSQSNQSKKSRKHQLELLQHYNISNSLKRNLGYDKIALQYQQEYYSYMTNLQIARFAQQKSNQEVIDQQFNHFKIYNSFPFYQLLRAFTQKFMLNEMETTFYLYTIKLTKKKYNDTIIKNFVKNHKFNFEIIQKMEVKNEEEYKYLIIYLIIVAYNIKQKLANKNEMEIIKQYLYRYVDLRFFMLIYLDSLLQELVNNWNHQNQDIDFTQKKINEFYNTLIKVQKDEKLQSSDYNAMVDTILMKCPAYKFSEEPRKKIKLNRQVINQEKGNIYEIQEPLASQLNVRSFAQQINIQEQRFITSGFAPFNQQGITQNPKFTNSLFNNVQFHQHQEDNSRLTRSKSREESYIIPQKEFSKGSNQGPLEIFVQRQNSGQRENFEQRQQQIPNSLTIGVSTQFIKK